MIDELSLRIEAILVSALLAIADRDKLVETIEPLRARRDDIGERLARIKPDGPMTKLVTRLGLAAPQVDFLWAAIAVAIEPWLTLHVESLGGPLARRGLSVAVFQRITGLDAGAGRDLASGSVAPTRWSTAACSCLSANRDRKPPVLCALRRVVDLRAITTGKDG